VRWALGFALAAVIGVAVSLHVVGGSPVGLPTFDTVRGAYQPSDVQLVDRRGAVIHELRVDPTRRRLAWTPLDEISPALQAAVIASEDHRFYQHTGVDPLAVVAAVLRRAVGGPARGASTISMQVATLIDTPSRRRTAPRTFAEKWRQMRLARALEGQWTKPQILEAYLNLATFRGELQGVAAAANVLFGKAAHGISEPEALVLAVLLRAPNAGPAEIEQRAERLSTAVRATVGRSETGTALVSAVVSALNAPPGTAPRAALAPHVARRLLRAAPPYASVQSTLDAEVQRVATEVLRRQLLALRTQRVRDGAVLVIDNATGDVLAYVGGSGELSRAPQVDGVRARRQAGSTLKPFLYGLAIEDRLLTAASLLDDAPLEIAVTGGLYRPQNYDEQFRGLVTVRTALSGSVNVPAVRTLGLVGTERFVQQLRRLGFVGVTQPGDYYGPSLALGSADVSLWEMVGAYRALANGGVWAPLRFTDDAPAVSPQRAYSAATAFIISDILADRESRSVTFGLESPLATRFWSAVKTGTSKDMRDNWCVGYSRRYTVGVWVGNFSGRPMRDVSGVSGAAPAWLEIMNWLHRDLPSAAPSAPHGSVAQRISVPEAALAERAEWFLSGTEPHAPDVSLARGSARIDAPVSGTVIAIDPDIPSPQQRVVFHARGVMSPAMWVLDGTRIGPASQLTLWAPQPGRHQLEVIDERDGRSLDATSFVVRGGAARTAVLEGDVPTP
jgi:penicillin-binding protein 1C